MLIKDSKTLPTELHQDFTALRVKPPVWSAKDWQEEWGQREVFVKLSNQVLDYDWKAADIFVDIFFIRGPFDPAQTVRKSLTEMLGGSAVEVCQRLEDQYETGPGLLVLIHEKTFPSK